MIEFEGLCAGISLIREEFGLLDVARQKAKADPTNRRLAATESRARASLREAKATGYKLIADEMLPVIMGGQWRQSDGLNWLYGRERTFFSRPIFDHVLGFRLIGAKGPNGWKNVVLVSQPYIGAVNDGKPTVSEETLLQAKSLRSDHSVGTWMRPDLSPYYPDETSLVLIGSGLDPDRAAGFGFVALA